MSTILETESSELSEKPEKCNSGADVEPRSASEKLGRVFTSKRRDSESSTNIDRRYILVLPPPNAIPAVILHTLGLRYYTRVVGLGPISYPKNYPSTPYLVLGNTLGMSVAVTYLTLVGTGRSLRLFFMLTC